MDLWERNVGKHIKVRIVRYYELRIGDNCAVNKLIVIRINGAKHNTRIHGTDTL